MIEVHAAQCCGHTLEERSCEHNQRARVADPRSGCGRFSSKSGKYLLRSRPTPVVLDIAVTLTRIWLNTVRGVCVSMSDMLPHLL